MSKMLFKIPGDDTNYYCPTSSKDVTLGKFESIMKVEREMMPQSLKDIVGAKNEEEKKRLLALVDDVEYSHRHIPYMAMFVSEMCDVPFNKLVGDGVEGFEGIHKRDIEMLFGNCSRSVSVYDIDEEFKSFVYNDTEYFLPNKFMEGSKVIEYMEASQYQSYYSKLEEGMWGALSFVIAILARPEGIGYREKDVLRNGEVFKNLSLNTAMNVSFFLIRLSEKLKRDSLFYSLVRLVEQSKLGLAS